MMSALLRPAQSIAMSVQRWFVETLVGGPLHVPHRFFLLFLCSTSTAFTSAWEQVECVVAPCGYGLLLIYVLLPSPSNASYLSTHSRTLVAPNTMRTPSSSSSPARPLFDFGFMVKLFRRQMPSPVRGCDCTFVFYSCPAVPVVLLCARQRSIGWRFAVGLVALLTSPLERTYAWTTHAWLDKGIFLCCPCCSRDDMTAVIVAHLASVRATEHTHIDSFGLHRCTCTRATVFTPAR